MSNVHLRIKVGVVEVEVEGSQEFVEGSFPDLLTRLLEKNGWRDGVEALKPNVRGEAAKAGAPSGQGFEHSTNAIASIMDVKTGPDLAMAACAHLSIVKGEAKFARKAILDEMQSATAYYNHNYSGNLTKILQSLMRAKKLNLVSNQTYSLPKSQIDNFLSLLEKE